MEIVFLPGASGSTDFWKPVKDGFDHHYSTKLISYPSFGGYAPHPQVQSMADLQNHVLSQIEQPSILIAQSMGGIFAVQAALQKPDLILAMVLVATSGGIDLKPFDVKDWRQEYSHSYDVPHWFIDDHTRLDDRLTEIQVPILLIWGDQDPISPVEVGEYLDKKFKLSQLKIIQNGQHDLANVHADECIEFIQQFILKYFTKTSE